VIPMDKAARVKRALAELHGIDAAPRIRAALAELRENYAVGRRMAEVDGPVDDKLMLECPVLLVEDAAGRWRCSTTKEDMFQGQKELFGVTERTEKLAVAEMRWRLAEELVGCRFCRPEEAKRLALVANVWVSGRVPFARIVTR
jgi:hypothetical protein